MMTGESAAPGALPSVSVAVSGICSADHMIACLEALHAQEGAPPFEIVVVHDPAIPEVERVKARFPGIRIVANEGQRTPMELASCAIKESSGELVLLTEDHCIPPPHWVRTMVLAKQPGRAAVGGRIEIRGDATATDWAFYFVDYFRYAGPVEEGPSPSLTVCNVCYRRSELESVREIWERFYHETAVNEALRQRYGTLHLLPASEVTVKRHVTLSDALYERYAFGRLFACMRNRFATPARRLYYVLLSPALPILILARMAQKALLRSPRLARDFLRSVVPLTLMVFAWAWGEWLGYVTNRYPKSMVVAAEIRVARRRGETAAS